MKLSIQTMRLMASLGDFAAIAALSFYTEGYVFSSISGVIHVTKGA